MNKKHWYSDCDIKKGGRRDDIFGGVFLLIFGTALIAGAFVLPPDWLDYYPAPLAMIAGPIMICASIAYLFAGSSHVIYTQEYIVVKCLFQTRKIAWSELSVYIKLDLCIGESAHWKKVVVPCYLLSQNSSSIEGAYHDIIEESVNENTGERALCPIFYVVHDKKFRDIYVLPASPEVEQLIQENNLTKYRKQWTGGSAK